MKRASIIYWASFVTCIDCCGICFKSPSYVSSWFQMQAQDDKKSELTIQHGLNKLPALVDIQVKPDGGIGQDFIFPGIGSAQRDDDLPTPYGGIVYMYNENSVMLLAPKKNDDSDSGTVIYTGDVWRGPQKLNVKKGRVRVRAWNTCDIPPPDYASEWMNVQSHNASGSFIEIAHGFSKEPEFVHVRVRLHDGHVTDGIGSSMLPDLISSQMYWGGVLYGYNRTHVRVWLPGTSSGHIFSATDGWGNTNPVWNNGSLQIRVWQSLNAKTFKSSLILVNDRASSEDLQAALPASSLQNTSTDLLILMVQPNVGPNKDFNFIGSGAVQNTASIGALGGIVYSYSNKAVRLYHPPFPKSQGGNLTSGYLLFINSNWGSGMYKQRTNNVSVVLQLWKSYTMCPFVPSQSTSQRSTSLQTSEIETSPTVNTNTEIQDTTSVTNQELTSFRISTTIQNSTKSLPITNLSISTTATTTADQATGATRSMVSTTSYETTQQKEYKNTTMLTSTNVISKVRSSRSALSGLASGLIGASVGLLTISGLSIAVAIVKRKLKQNSQVAQELSTADETHMVEEDKTLEEETSVKDKTSQGDAEGRESNETKTVENNSDDQILL